MSESDYWPDEASCQAHPRYLYMTANIHARRGRRTAINIPIFKDVKTSLFNSTDCVSLKEPPFVDSAKKSAKGP